MVGSCSMVCRMARSIAATSRIHLRSSVYRLRVPERARGQSTFVGTEINVARTHGQPIPLSDCRRNRIATPRLRSCTSCRTSALVGSLSGRTRRDGAVRSRKVSSPPWRLRRSDEAGPLLPIGARARHRHGRLEAFGIHSRGHGFKTDIHPFLAAQCTIAGDRAGYEDKSSVGPNCVGFTKILTTSASHCNRAARMRERWPSCSAPIVGTNPMVTPSRRNRSLHAVMDCGVRIIFMSLGAGCKQGETHNGLKAGETGGGPPAASQPQRAIG